MQAQLDAITDEDARQEALLEAQYEQWRNKAISDPYEPGSVFKIITASAVLEEKVVGLNNSFTCTGSYESAGGLSLLEAGRARYSEFCPDPAKLL